MRRILTAVMFGAMCLMPSVAEAGRVVLKNGGTIEGRIERHDDRVVVTRGGMVSETPAADILRIEDVETEWDLYTAKYESTDWSHAGAILALADFAREHGLDGEIKGLYRKVLAVEPGHPEANRALGRCQYNGRWMSEDDMMAHAGMVRAGEQWVTREEAAVRRAAERYETDLSERKERIARLFEEMASQDGQIASRARKQLQEIDKEMPGLARNLRASEQYFGENRDIAFDGKYVTFALRLTKAGPDNQTVPGGILGLVVKLGTWGDAGTVVIQLPQIEIVKINATIMVPAY